MEHYLQSTSKIIIFGFWLHSNTMKNFYVILFTVTSKSIVMIYKLSTNHLKIKWAKKAYTWVKFVVKSHQALAWHGPLSLDAPLPFSPKNGKWHLSYILSFISLIFLPATQLKNTTNAEKHINFLTNPLLNSSLECVASQFSYTNIHLKHTLM